MHSKQQHRDRLALAAACLQAANAVDRTFWRVARRHGRDEERRRIAARMAWRKRRLVEIKLLRGGCDHWTATLYHSIFRTALANASKVNDRPFGAEP